MYFYGWVEIECVRRSHSLWVGGGEMRYREGRKED
jgi:hypothetical protein